MACTYGKYQRERSGATNSTGIQGTLVAVCGGGALSSRHRIQPVSLIATANEPVDMTVCRTGTRHTP